MDSTLLVVCALIALALCFDFINGFHDAANSIATVVSTRVLSPGQAVAWAAFFNFVPRSVRHRGREDGRIGHDRPRGS
jgi:PiT family inorganic phosphate transporter